MFLMNFEIIDLDTFVYSRMQLKTKDMCWKEILLQELLRSYQCFFVSLNFRLNWFDGMALFLVQVNAGAGS